jgi:hypothetical protein
VAQALAHLTVYSGAMLDLQRFVVAPPLPFIAVADYQRESDAQGRRDENFGPPCRKVLHVGRLVSSPKSGSLYFSMQDIYKADKSRYTLIQREDQTNPKTLHRLGYSLVRPCPESYPLKSALICTNP